MKMTRRTAVQLLAWHRRRPVPAQDLGPSRRPRQRGALAASAHTDPRPAGLGVAAGPFQPTLESLSAFQVPDWYRDAKFGIWAHWGPQCQPEQGDWYAQNIYLPAQAVYKFHVQKYGHPSKFGFKDVCNEWKADKWEPEKLIALYKQPARSSSRPWPTITTTLTFSIRNTSPGTASRSVPRRTSLAAG